MSDLQQRIAELSPEKRRLLLRKLAERREGPQGPPPIVRLERAAGARFPLSFSQQRLWFLDQLEPGSAAYNIPLALHLAGRLDVSALRRSIAGVVKRHETLRTTFATENGVAVQVVCAADPPRIGQVDLRGLSPLLRDAETSRLVGHEAQQPFDLARGPLLRCRLLQLADDDYAVLLTLHHIVSDGWSGGVLVREISAFYDAFAAGHEPALAELPVQYADFAAWQRQWLAGEVLRHHLDYWKEQLAGAPPLLELPIDRPRPRMRTYRGSNVHFLLPQSLTGTLRRRSQERQATLFMALLAGFGTLLHRYSHERDVLIGSPIANRSDETEGLIGFFVNTLVLRVSLAGDPDVDELIQRLRRVTLGAYGHQNLPFEMLVDEMQPERVLGHTPLFQVMLTYQNVPQQEFDLPALSITEFPAAATAAQFDLELLVVEGPGDLECSLIYSTELFDASTARRMTRHLLTLLAAVATSPAERVSRLPLLGPAEAHQLVVDWNDTAARPAGPELTPELLARQSTRTPDAVALCCPGETWSYRHLGRQAAKVALAIRDAGIAPEGVVAVLVPRGSELAAALLGCFTAGVAYLPLDPHHPPLRLHQVLDRSGAALVLTARELAGKLAEALAPHGRGNVRVRSLEEVLASDAPGATPSSPVSPSRLAYVIYTSGSTGVPKGVMIEHRGMLNHLRAKIEDLEANAADVVAQTASQCFDISICQFVIPWLLGGRVSICTDEVVRDPALFLDRLEDDRITILETVPSILAMLAEESAIRGARRPALAALRWMVPTGETLPPELARHLLAAYPHVLLLNAYGPTECSDDVSHHRIERPPSPAMVHIPVGRPIRDMRLYVVDRWLRPVPVGVIGDMMAAGIGVGRGYLGDPRRTASTFLPDPFAEHGGARIYRIGDVARFLADGTIEFLGRRDGQVKVRGFRIELGEIEAVLLRQSAVREAVVVNRGTRLIAYLVAHPGTTLTAAELRAGLAETLPEYMVPAAFVLLAALPLTASGKVDRAALPDPGLAQSEPERQVVAPRTPVEKTLVAIWKEVLELDQVGVHDNFFALGGDSILSIKIVAQARRAHLTLAVKDLFESQTVAELAARIEAAADTVTRPAAAPLTDAQQRWLAATADAPRAVGRCALFVSEKRLTTAAWRRILAGLIDHHEALRLQFEHRDDAWRQRVAGAPDPLPATDLDLSSIPAEARRDAVRSAARSLATALDPVPGNALRAGLVVADGRVEGLLLTLHPLVADDASWRIVGKDLDTLSGQAAMGSELGLAAPAPSFLAWAQRQDRGTQAPEAPPAPVRRAHRLHLTPTASETLVSRLSATYRIRLEEGLITALARTLGRPGSPWRIDVARDGRRGAEPGLTHTVGQLTTLMPFCFELPPDAWDATGAGAALKAVKEQARKTPANRAVPSVPAEVLFEARASPGRSAVSGQTEMIELVPLEAPPGAYSLTVTSRWQDDHLEFAWSFGMARPRAEIATLAAAFRTELEALIEHCRQPHAGGYTPSDFPLAGLDQAALDRALAEDRDVEDVYPLAPTQAGMLFAHLFAEEVHPFFEQASWTLHGALHVGALKLAWVEMVKRHPALRTYFLWEGLDEPRQVVRRHVDLGWQELDWRDLEPPVQRRRMRELLVADRRHGLDLRRPPLMRLSLVRLADETYQFTWSWHHIVLDGWSLTMLTQEGLAIYEGYRQGQEVRLEPRRPYRDYVAWLLAQKKEDAEAFWRHKLAGYSAPLTLSIDRRPGGPPGGSGHYHGRDFEVPPPAADALRSLARRHGLTLASIFQGIWALILSHYSGTDDVVFGITSSGRPAELEGVDSMVGLFLSTLPARLRVTPRSGALEWLHEVQRQHVELRSYEYSTLVEIQGWSEVPAHQPLFETFLIYQNFPEVSEAQWSSRSIEVEGADGFDQATDPLLVLVSPGRRLVLRVSYDCERFDGTGVRRILGQILALIEGLTAAPERPLNQLPRLRVAERHQALYEWNDTATGLVAGLEPSSVPGLFERQVRRAPEAVALVSGESAWTYGEVNRQANRLAWAVKRRGLGTEGIVAFLVERGIDFLTVLLGVFKAGAAYVPLDPRYPAARRRQILDQSGARLAIASRVHAAALAETLTHGAASPCRSEILDELLAGEARADDPAHAWDPQGLAYVIYTSGSTGAPKGAMIEHQGMLNHVWDKILRFTLTPADAVAQTAALTFDISVWQYLAILLAGGRLEVFDDEVAHAPWRLMLEVESRRLSILETGPTLLGLLVEEMEQFAAKRPRAPRLRWLLVSGEALPPPLCRLWLGLYPHVPLLNAYGATECSDDVTHHPVRRPLAADAAYVPLGYPMPDSTLYVLDRELRPVASGVPGEIFMGGVCVGRGYHGDPVRTALAFVPDPFAARPGQRFYRSGDLGRYRHDGNTEFLGRIDFQVKVRGFRIELGEIESVLSEHPAVHLAAVLARKRGRGDPLLAAYVVPVEGEEPDPQDLAAFLARRLPDYMVPGAYLLLESFPLNANGKLDRGALGRHALPEPAEAVVTTPPRTPVEERLVEIWSEVLGRGEVGVHDNFFDLGGHSLRAIQVSSRLRRTFGIEVPMRELFEAPTIAELAAAVDKALVRAETESLLLEPVPRGRPLPLSFSQQRLWFLDQLEPGSTAYNMNSAVRLSGPLDLGALALSFTEVARRHEVLRTTFTAPEGEPLQVIHPPEPLPLRVVDLSALSEATRTAVLDRLGRAEREMPFDLARGPILRVAVVRLSADEHVALAGMHHIASDAWSFEIFEREVRALYGAFSRGEPSPLAPLPIQYADYAWWQRQWLAGERLERELEIWRQRLAAAPAALDLPTDRPRAAMRTAAGASVTMPLPRGLSEQVRALCRQEGVTLFMALLAAFKGLLARYTGELDVVVGTPSAGRTRTEIENLIGFFVNTLVLRTRLVDDPCFRELLARVKEVSLEAQAHQHLPFEKLVEELEPERSLSHSPLFQVMFSVQTVDEEGEAPERTDVVEARGGSEPFDLSLVVWDGSGLVTTASYVRDLFDPTTIRRLLRHLKTLLTDVVRDPHRPLSRWPLLAASETHQLLIAWNDTAVRRDGEATIPALVAAQMARSPDAVALVSADRYVTFGDLGRRSRALAHRLRALGVGPEVRVAVFAERSPERVVALLGVLAAGGAFVPLGPDFPAARLAMMLQDAEVRVIVASEPLAGRLPEHPADVLILDAERPAAGGRPLPPLPVGRPDQLAYVIFTSGSTGRPKGVMNSHRGVVNRLLWLEEARGLTPEDRLLQKTPFTFDVSVWELFWPLIAGRPLIVAKPGGHRDSAYLARLIAEQRITLAHFVPSMLGAFLEEPATAACRNLRRVVASGEALTPELVQRFFAGPEASLENLYGPTEAAVEVTYQLCRPEPGSVTVPIGRPAPGCRIHLLDRTSEPVPAGVAAELHIGGVQLARGYADRPALTAAAFVPDAVGGEPGRRLYRSGDLARHRPDGTIEFLGRRDHQVKVRGYRIELGEIEAVLGQHPRLREAVVLARPQRRGELVLTAYAVAGEGGAPPAGEVAAWLLEKLPDYMVPASWVFLASLPLTASGKVDRLALAGMAPKGTDSAPYVAPRDAFESLLAEIFGELLEVGRVGADGDFFALGGHSLLATRLMSRVRRAFGVDLPLRSLFENPTVAALAREVRWAERPAVPALALVAGRRLGPQPLSFAQQRLWFIDQLEPGSSVYNLPAAVRFEGGLDLPALAAAITEVVRRHQILRTVYRVEKDEPVQVVLPAAAVPLPLVDISALPSSVRWTLARQLAAAAAARPFDLARGPVVRAGVVRLGPADHVLLATMHHIASDGWSMGILNREVGVLYDAFHRRRPSPFDELPIQYADYAVWQRQWLCDEVLEAEIGHWRQLLAGAPPVLELPTDRPRPAVATSAGASRRVALGAALTAELQAVSRASGATLFMTLLAGFTALLARVTGQNDLSVGTPIAGRNRLEVEGLIGFFVNTLVLRVGAAGDPPFRELVDRVREVSLEAHTHQDLPFEKLVEELDPERSLSYTPLFQVLFALQNVPRDGAEIEGLTISGLGVEGATTQFDLSLTLDEGLSGLVGGLAYNTDLFDAVTVQRLAGHLRRLLAAAAADPGLCLSELPVLEPAEAHQVVHEWNDTATAADESLMHELVWRQAQRRPEALAVALGAAAISYGELTGRAEQLARRLHASGIGPEVAVGVYLGRTPNLIVALLAVLRAGGFYMPLDPTYPAERLAFMIEDSGAPVLLTEASLAGRLPEFPGVAQILVDELAAPARVRTGGRSPAGRRNLAYLIYTSGSTGRPKGVAIEHASFLNFVRWLRRTYRLTEADRAGQFFAAGFDGSIMEIWPALTAGASLHLAPDDLRDDAGRLLAWLAAEKLTLLCLPTPMAEATLDETWPAGIAVRTFLSGGDRLHRGFPDGQDFSFFNLYGPTENTVAATACRVPAGKLAAAPSIGRPLDGVRVLILDRALRPLPIGAAGELCIGGRSLARGYLGRPAQTAEVFVPSAFGREPGARLYRTGDLARLRGHGELEFLGRIDHQVKVRGFRIELGEIEAVLSEHPAVREAAVLAREGDGQVGTTLIAYLAAAEPPPSVGELREDLEARLPAYMVPFHFVILDALPLTPNGKVDRRALAALAAAQPQPEAAYVAPRSAAEELLCETFAAVLGVERVGLGDNFFDLGGHSLLATRLVARVSSAFGVELRVRELFEAPTVGELALALGSARVAAAQRPPLVARRDAGTAPLSFAQQRLWFLDRLEPGNTAYNIPLAMRLEGELDVGSLKRCLSEVVRRHEVLRTRFEQRGDEPVQVVDRAAPLALPVVDLESLGMAARRSVVERWARDEAARSFDLERGPLVRVSLLRLTRDDHVLMATMHHIVSDGWSMAILYREVGLLYEAFRTGRRPPLAELPIQYGDYAAWQRSWLHGAVLEVEIAHWRECLAGAPAVLDLPTDRPRPPIVSLRGAERACRLPAELSRDLRAFSRRQGATLFMTLLATFEVLVSRWTGARDLTVGTPISGRNRLEVEGVIGFFVNTLVLRADLTGDPSFRELVARVREASLEAQAHQDLPFEKLVEELDPVRSLSHPPLFQVLFAFQNLPFETGDSGMGGLRVSPLGVVGTTAKLDLGLVMSEEGENDLFGVWEYSTDLFDATTIERLAGLLERLLSAAVATPERRFSELPVLNPAQTHQIVYEWNDTAAAAADESLVHELVWRQARRRPEALAVALGAAAISYGELAGRAEQLARRLHASGIGPEVPVGIYLGRTPNLIVALLAVLRAGGFYMPLDPAYPAERLAFMIEDSGTPVLLTEASLAGRLPEFPGVAQILVDELAAPAPVRPGGRSPAGRRNLAYLIYTSGSTGRPKGVAIEHASFLNFVRWLRRTYRPTEADRAGQFFAVGFDGSVAEIWPTLTAGASLHLAPDDLRDDAGRLLAWLAAEKLTLLCLPTPVAEATLDETWPAGMALRALLSGGDRLHRGFPAGHDLSFFNLYGPTENTVTATAGRVPAGKLAAAPSIGRPLDGVRVLILDRALRPLPIGAAGELCIGGRSLARGYLGRPAQTAEVFVPSAFGREPGARLYRTGDLARLCGHGEIDFLGRIDHQVKVRGFRIELGEIEAVLSEHPAVREAAVLAREDGPGGKSLAAYVSAAGGAAPEPAELRADLAARLPDYMVPQAFVVLDALPLTPNGKIDRRALEELALVQSAAEAPYAAPRTMTEELVAEIFAEVLSAERVGIDDDFFQLGGHSLLATRLTSRLRPACGVEVPVRALFETPTVAGLARVVDAARRTAARQELPALVARPPGQGPPPLSFAQQRLWFLDLLEPGSAAYNIPLAMRLEGELDVGALERSLSEVARRHEVLRTRFEERGGEPVQVVSEAAELALPVVDLGGLGEAARRSAVERWGHEEAARPFDLKRGPLMRVGLLRLAPDDHVLLATMHHIVSDGWSIGILHREVGSLYGAFQAGRRPPLAELPIQYGDYAAWQRGWLRGEVLAAEVAHWRERLAGAPAILDLPTDRPRPPVMTYRGREHAFSLEAGLSRDLQALCRRQGATPFMALLASFEALLSRWTGARDLTVGTLISGRNRLEVEGLIGFFVNTLVLRADLSGDATFHELMGRVREVSLEAHAHQDLPFEKLVEELEPVRDFSSTPLFQVLFSFQTALFGDGIDGLGGLSVSPLDSAATTAKFDLTLAMSGDQEALSGSFEYRTDLFDATTMARLARHFEVLLRAAVTDPERHLSELPLLAAAQAHQLLREWNDSDVERRPAMPIHQLFEAHAQRCPESTAVVDGDRHLSYRELEQRANRLARYLRRLEVGREVRVGICLDRSLEIAVAVLAVLKAGSAFVPLDLGNPRERLAFMIEDAGLRALISESRWLDRLPESGAKQVLLDRDRKQIDAQSPAAVPAAIRADDVAYVIYTSGSTGRPKGIMVPHGGLPNAIDAGVEAGSVKPGERFVQVTALSFDISVFEILVPLTTGGVLVMVNRETLLSGAGLVDFLRLREIDHMITTPSNLASLPPAPLPRLVTMAVVGEACSAELVNDWAPGRRFLNVYGPAEATIWSTGISCQPDPDGRPPTIGPPISNTQCYVVDRRQRPVPVGTVGELLLGGPGVTRGYLGRPALTAERFVPSPFGTACERLYRTGDLVRYRCSGELDFLGRLDHQVKVRGFRIELGEIEAVLRRHPSVADAVVIARPDPRGDIALVAYLVTAGGPLPPVSELRDDLDELLPGHMIPAAFVELPALPLNPNGKVDRAALPEPQHQAREESVAPRDDLERLLTEIWEDVLGVGAFGVTDSFFELGGHSLLVVRLMSCIREVTGRSLPLASLFERPTIENLAQRLREETPESEDRSLVCLRPGETRPIFLVHPVGGNVLCYVDLANHLPAGRPVFALQVPRRDGRRPQSIEEMASAYLEEVCEVQKQGPYLLGGWSMGGVVAFEMARQLRRAGELVDQLVLIDTPAPASGYYQTIREADLMAAFARDLAGVGGVDGAQIPTELPPDATVHELWQQARAARLLPADVDFETIEKLFTTFQRNSRALARYRGGRYPGPLTLMRCQEGPGDMGPSLGWGDQVNGRLVVRSVPGNHYSVLRKPHLASLVAVLTEALADDD